MPFNDSGVGKFSRLRFKDLSGWLSKLENVYKLGGEICARPLVQESVKKAMHRVVGEDCSLVRYEFVLAECIIHALFLSQRLRQRCASSRA